MMKSAAMKNSEYSLYQSGLTLIELMIAMLLGLLLISAVMGVFLSSNRNYTQDDNLARMQENGRFTMRRLDDELLMANYWGGLTHVSNLSLSGVVFPAPICNVSINPASPATSISVSTNPADFGACVPDHVIGTPILVVRRALGKKVTVQTPKLFYIITNEASGRIREYDASDTSSIPAAGESAREYSIRMYYLRTVNAAGLSVPTLYMRRLELDASGVLDLVQHELAEGIEVFNVDFGVDTSGDGTPERYTNAPLLTEFPKLVTARTYLLTRAINSDEVFKDDKIYTLGSVTYTPPVAVNNFRRRLFSITTVMRNTAYLAVMNKD